MEEKQEEKIMKEQKKRKREGGMQKSETRKGMRKEWRHVSFVENLGV